MPRRREQSGVVRRQCPQVHHVPHAGGLGSIEQRLAMHQHIDAVSGEQENRIDAANGFRNGTAIREVKANRSNAPHPIRFPVSVGTSRRAADLTLVSSPNQARHDRATHGAGRARHQNPARTVARHAVTPI